MKLLKSIVILETIAILLMAIALLKIFYHPESAYFRGYIYDKYGYHENYHKALEDMIKAGDIRAHFNLAVDLKEEGKFDLAEMHYNSVISKAETFAKRAKEYLAKIKERKTIEEGEIK